jgi:hypothetical protein
MTIKEIIQKLHTTMTDARGQESHFESWLTLNEGICNAIDAMKALDKQEPVDFDAIIADIEAISCRYRGDPSHDHCPYKIRSESADTVRRHASYYTTPPQRKPLTNDAARKLWSHIENVTVSEAVMLLSVVRATEAAHGIKEKNT